MNTNSLDKLYSQLSAKERLALTIAAGCRDDASERQRLADSAPRQRFEAGHHYDLGTALLEAAHLHLLTLLDLAAKYWQCWGLCGWRNFQRHASTVARADSARKRRQPDEQELRLIGQVRYHAFLFVTHVDGWKRFCAEWPMEPESLLDHQPGWDMVQQTERRARENAYCEEDAAFFLLAHRPIPEPFAEGIARPELITVEGLAEAWRTVMARQVAPEKGKS
jgi:hypothetical protein